MPRAASSWGRSSFLSLLKLLPCVSQVALASGAHEMQATRVPASMSLRAQERALAVDVAAIGITQPGMLAVELERAPGLRGGEQIERTGLETVHLLEPTVCAPRVGSMAHAGEEPLAIAEPSEPDPFGEPKLRHPEIRRTRVVEYEQGVDITAEPAAEETRLRRTAGPFGRDVRHRNIRWNHRARGTAKAHDRTDRRVVVRARADGHRCVAAIMTGQADVDGRCVCIVHAVVDRPDQGCVVHEPRQAGQVLADGDAGEARVESAGTLRGSPRVRRVSCPTYRGGSARHRGTG